MDKQVFEQRMEDLWETLDNATPTDSQLEKVNSKIKFLELAHTHISTANIEDERAAIMEAVRCVRARSDRGLREKVWAEKICDEILNEIAKRTGTQLEVIDEL